MNQRPLVLVPGLQSGPLSWHNQISEFSVGQKVIVPSGYHHCASIAEMSRTIAPQLPDEEFHLVGWSMGGYIAQQLVREEGLRIRSLVLVATSARPDDPDVSGQRRRLIKVAERKGLAKVVREGFEAAHHDPSRIAREYAEAAIAQSVELGLEAYRAQQQAIINRPDQRKNLASLKLPALVVHGQDDQVIPCVRGAEIAHVIPGAKWVPLRECGHSPPLEMPDAFNSILGQWLAD